MAPKIPAVPSTPPRRQAVPEVRARVPNTTMLGNIIGSQAVLVPPSPGFLDPTNNPQVSFGTPPSTPVGASPFVNLTQTDFAFHKPSSSTAIKTKTHIGNDTTNAGVKKTQKIARKQSIKNLVKAVAGIRETVGSDTKNKVFRFLDLPPEIRNLIYEHTMKGSQQALIRHRPRFATLRPRTRLDRTRPMDSAVKDQELAQELDSSPKAKSTKEPLPRESHRPFVTLTHVNRQIRQEFRPIFLQKQELGLDVTQAVEYMRTFYPSAAQEFLNIQHVQHAPAKPKSRRPRDLPFTGNITIAIGDVPSEAEKSPHGIEILPLLDIWANSFRMEAGFGRYMKAQYIPEADGEAKDLYRLFGRKVLKGRTCSQMNVLWREILRKRALASITIHRKPAPTMVTLMTYLAAAGRLVPVPGTLITHNLHALIPVETKPFIHIMFRPEFAAPWMVNSISRLPEGWLERRGFGGMEYFDLKIGRAPAGVDKRV